MADPGIMIPLNEQDYDNYPWNHTTRNICDASFQQAYTKAQWWTCENIRLTTVEGAPTPSAVVGTPCVIQVGIQGLLYSDGAAGTSIQNVEAWACYPNTVPGGIGQTSATLVVPSMQNSKYASFSNTTDSAPYVFGSADASAYQSEAEGAFRWIELPPWTPTPEDFIEQSEHGGDCCIIANAAGQSTTGVPVGTPISDNSGLSNIDVCHSPYQGQRNIVILPIGGLVNLGDIGALSGKRIHLKKRKFVFLSGAPEQTNSLRTTIAARAIDQAGQVDRAVHKALASAGLHLKPATSPPRSLHLSVYDHKHHARLVEIVHEAEEIVEDLLELDEHPFGGGHQLQLSLPPKGLQPLRVDIELDPDEPLGTVHAIDITQTDANGARGGIRVVLVVTS